MKLRSYFKRKTQEAVHRIYPNANSKWARFRAIVNKRPKRTVAILMSIVLINVLLLFSFTDHFKPLSIVELSTKMRHREPDQIPSMGIPFTLENYRMMSAIQDTLAYLASKQARSAADTLIMLRLFERIEKIDPGFFKAIDQKLKNQQDSAKTKAKVKNRKDSLPNTNPGGPNSGRLPINQDKRLKDSILRSWKH
ncbi:hypothetical protein ACLOAU_04540 [Niabella sp. CJ426]|uniref:hypothetical protein n=1 Tax=Niabella sp. CJ426 TaxID=3393740 RepID=UPI003D07978A